MVCRVLDDVHVDYLLGIFKQLATIRTEVLQMYFLPSEIVSLSKLVQCLNTRHIHHSALRKIDDHFFRIICNIKFIVERRNRSKKQWPENLIVLHAFVINIFSGANALCVLPGEYQRSDNYSRTRPPPNVCARV